MDHTRAGQRALWRSRALWALLAVFFFLATTYSVVTPLYEAPDEAQHYPFVRQLAMGGGLPVQDPAHPGPWLQEGSQPPLYYALAALASRWADASDLEQVLRPNTRADIGIARPDGNANYALHTASERFPYRGAVLAIHLARLFSVFLGALTVLFTYLLACDVLGTGGVALAAAALAAFTPQFLFLSGAVSNDNLVICLSTATLWLVLRLVRRPLPLWRWGLAGLLVGLAALSKVSGLGLLAPAFLALTWAAWRRRSGRLLFLGGAALAAVALLVAGWWYARNVLLYGDPLGWNAMLAIIGRRAHTLSLREVWSEWPGFARSYWGVFGWMNVPMPEWVYGVCEGIALVGAAGLLLALGRNLRARRLPEPEQAFRLLLLAAWPVIVLIGLVRWTSLTTASQGRLLFPAIAPLSLFLAAGLAEIAQFTAPVKRSGGTPLAAWLQGRGRGLLPGAAAVVLAGLAFWAPWGVIAPAYARPPLLTPAQEAAIPHRLDYLVGDSIELLGYRLETAEVQPGGSVPVTLYWQARQDLAEDDLVFVHLVDETGQIVGGRDVHPGGGRFQTSLWRAGDALADEYVLTLSPDTYCPSQLAVEVGLYQPGSGKRLPVRDSEGHSLGDCVRFGQMLVHRAPGELNNPTYYDFGGRLILRGYALDRRLLRPGDAVHVSLFWQPGAPAPAMHGLVLFTGLIDDNGKPWADLSAPPRLSDSWQPGQIITDVRELVLRPDVLPGAYRLDAAVYAPDKGNLLLRSVKGEVLGNHIPLAQVRVLPASGPTPEPTPKPLEPAPHFPGLARLEAFAVQPGPLLVVTLYWRAESEGPMATDFTVFVHLLDAQGRIIAQHDGPPALGERPTSGWQADELIVDRHALADVGAPYAGEASIEIGLYNPQTLQRLPTADGADHILLPVRIDMSADRAEPQILFEPSMSNTSQGLSH